MKMARCAVTCSDGSRFSYFRNATWLVLWEGAELFFQDETTSW